MCDFQGKTLELLTINHWPEVSVWQNVSLSDLPKNHDGISNTYKITHQSEGWLKDVLDIASFVCNFTFELYIRTDEIGSDIRSNSNGTFTYSGAFENLLETNKYHGLWAIKTIRQRRAEKVDFLQPLKMFTESLVINQNGEDISYDWKLLFGTMSPMIWILLLLISILPSMFIGCHEYLIKRNEKSWLYATMKRYPAALAVNFGGKFLSQSDPHRITLLVQYLFYGIVVWITFRAELTSELSIKIKKDPFHDLQGIVDSNYILLTSLKTNSLGQKFINSEKGSIYGKLFENNVDENLSFLGSDKAVQVLNDTKGRPKAIYDYNEELLQKAKLHNICGLRTVWKHSMPQPGSVSFKKGFEFTNEFDSIVRKIVEVGIHQKLLSKYFATDEQCEVEQSIGTPLGYRKLVSLFAILLGGYILSLLCFGIETIRFHYRKCITIVRNNRT